MFTVTICSMSPLVLPWLIYIMIPILGAQEVNVMGYLGDDVTLPCQVITRPEDTILQVQWQLEQPDGKKINIIHHQSQVGVLVTESFLKERVEIEERSLIIRDVEMSDAGSYICSVTAYPSGAFEGTTNLHVQVLGAQEVNVMGYLGHDVTLPCQAITRPEDTILQVQWQLEQPDGKKINIIHYQSRVGVGVTESFLKERVAIEERSLIIRDVEMSDAGSYICSVAVFPSGTFEGTTNLHVQGAMLILPRMIAAGVFLLIVVTMLATTYSIIIRIRRKALVRHRVCTDAGGPVMCE